MRHRIRLPATNIEVGFIALFGGIGVGDGGEDIITTEASADILNFDKITRLQYGFAKALTFSLNHFILNIFHQAFGQGLGLIGLRNKLVDYLTFNRTSKSRRGAAGGIISANLRTYAADRASPANNLLFCLEIPALDNNLI